MFIMVDTWGIDKDLEALLPDLSALPTCLQRQQGSGAGV